MLKLTTECIYDFVWCMDHYQTNYRYTVKKTIPSLNGFVEYDTNTICYKHLATHEQCNLNIYTERDALKLQFRQHPAIHTNYSFIKLHHFKRERFKSI